jgi:hypothetical protein
MDHTVVSSCMDRINDGGGSPLHAIDDENMNWEVIVIADIPKYIWLALPPTPWIPSR